MGDFVSIPFDTSSEALVDRVVDYLRTALPGWEPADGSLENHLIEGLARIQVEIMQMASTVPDSAFQRFGEELVALPPLEGVKATVATTWTATDNLGHVIPAGTQVGYRVSPDSMVVFEVTEDATILPGSTALSPVVLSATDVGGGWNTVPAGPLELVDALSWVSTVVANSASAGGVDAETDDAYKDRLAAELRLLTPRPILPDDFAVLARRVTGVYRALAVDGLDPGVNEIQRVTITGTPMGGSFPLTYSGQTASGIPFNATATQVQAALIGLSNIGAGDVLCTGGPLPGTPVDVEFTGALGGTNVSAMTTSSGSLTGGTSPAVAVTTPTAGVAGSTSNERMVTVIPVTDTGGTATAAVRASVATYLDGLREVTFVVHTATPTYTTVNVAFTVKVASGYDTSTVVDACEAAVAAYLDPANWAGGADSPPVWRSGEDKVRYLAVSAVISATPGVQYVTALTVNSGTSDVTLSGVAPLPAVGTVTGAAA